MQKQFSEDDWFDLSQEFFSKNPPQFWELNRCIKSFPKFLKKKKMKPNLIELAEYELIDLETFINIANVKKELGVTNPTLATRLFQYQIYDWVARKASPEKPPQQKPEVLVFYRNTDHDCYVRKADPLMLLILDHFRTPGAHLCDLEPVRAKLLPGNSVDLSLVLDDLVHNDLVLL